MSYPQPDSNQYVVDGFEFFRLNTLLSSPGDIYESSQGGFGFALGPDSDIASVLVSYFDSQAPDFMSQFTLSPDRSFVGRVDANILGTYAPSQRPARVLIAPDNLWNDQYLPTGFEDGVDANIVVTPRLDVIQYFQPQESLVPKRDDKTFVFQALDVGGTVGTLYVTVPYYGRKYADYKVHVPANAAGLSAVDVVVRGVTLEIIDDNNGFNQYDTFLATAANQRVYQNVIKAGTVNPASTTDFGGGMYDLLTFALTNHDPDHVLDKPVLLQITMSDTPLG